MEGIKMHTKLRKCVTHLLLVEVSDSICIFRQLMRSSALKIQV